MTLAAVGAPLVAQARAKAASHFGEWARGFSAYGSITIEPGFAFCRHSLLEKKIMEAFFSLEANLFCFVAFSNVL